MRVLYPLMVALIGWCGGLRHTVEYHYKYSGRIRTGIPGIRRQFSVTGLEAKLVLQMKTPTQGIAKLTDIHVASLNDDVSCNETDHSQTLYFSPISETYRADFEQPFGINFAEEKGHVITVPKSELEFITNIKKSVIGILRVKPIIDQLGYKSKGDVLKEDSTYLPFVNQEETIFGRCENQYTLTKLPEHLAREEIKEIEKHLTKDEQLERSSQRTRLPKLENKLSRLIKAVSFDKCHEPVILTHSGVSNFPEAGHGQFESVQSRSSVSSYILRGDENNYRIERAIIEGDVILNPFGYKMNRLHAITYQTLTLEAVQSIKTSLRLPSPSRNVKTWRYEVASPFEAPAGSPRVWVNYHSKGDRFAPVPSYAYLLGIFPTQRIAEQYKSAIKHILDEVVDEIETVPEPPHTSNSDPSSHRGAVATSKVYALSKMMRSLDVKDVEEIFSEVFQENDRKGEMKQILLVDIAAASGASAPMKVLLEKIQDSSISAARAATIFMTLTNHMISPVVIPELMKFAMSVDVEKNPLLSSAVLINFAILAHRMCLSHSVPNHYVPTPIFGNEVCNAELIISQFLPYLTGKVKSAKSSWQEAVYMKAASSLGSAHVISALWPYIKGRSQISQKARLLSIFALSKKQMPSSVREEICSLLTGIIDDLSEQPQIRQAAVTVLLSWNPDAAWWQKIAQLTWREPDQSMATFFTFIVEKVSHATDPHLHRQANIAASVLPLMKPLILSNKYSYKFFYSTYDPISKMTPGLHLFYFKDSELDFSSEFALSLRNNIGGLNLNLLKVILSSNGLETSLNDIADQFNTTSKNEDRYDSFPTIDLGEMFPVDILNYTEDYSEKNTEKHSEKKAPEIYTDIRAFDNIKIFLPIVPETLTNLTGTAGANPLKELLEGKKISAAKYFNPIEVQFSFPSEIGLPILCSAALPTINVVEGEVKLETDDESSDNPSISDILRSRHTRLLFKSNYRLMSKLMVNLTVPVPWEENVIEAGVQTFREVNLPIYGNLSVTNTHEIKNVTFNLSPYHRREFPVVYAYNIPYSVIRPLVPTENGKNDLKIIASTRQRKPLVERETKLNEKLTGLKATLKYVGDVPYPFTTSFLLDYLRRPTSFAKLLASPTSKQWQVAANLDPSHSSTKNISLSLTYFSEVESESPKQVPTVMSSSQNASGLPEFLATDSQRQRIKKLKEFASGNLVRAINAQLFFSGSEFRKYEALLGLALKNSSEDSEKEYKSLIAILSEHGEGAEPKAYCLGADMRTPGITDFERLKEAVSSGPKESIRGELYYGRSCSSRAIASFEGEAKMSSELQKEVSEELKEVCDNDQQNPVYELQTVAIYDEGKLEIKYSMADMPEQLVNLTYTVEKFLEGLVWPKAEYNTLNVSNPDGEISMEAKRPLESRNFNVWIQKPGHSEFIESLRIPESITRIDNALSVLEPDTAPSKGVLSRSGANVCSMDHFMKTVITFDGKSYPYVPSPCWTVTVRDNSEQTGFVLESRINKENVLEARINFKSENTVIQVSKGKAYVNGNEMGRRAGYYPIKGRSGKTVALVRKDREGYELKITNKLLLVAYDGLYITPKYQPPKPQLRGLCGDFDGSTEDDLTGPQNCLYNDVELFKYAWTSREGDGCNWRTMVREKTMVRRFQERCTRRGVTYVNDTLVNLYYRDFVGQGCYMHVYVIQRSGDGLCVTTDTAQRCSSDCRVSWQNVEIDKFQGKCWPGPDIPPEVKKAAIDVGYLLHPVKEPGKYQRELMVKQEELCFQF